MRNILVTGANGCIGHALTRVLVESGYNVTTLDLVPPKTSPIGDIGGIRIVCGDVTDEKILQRVFDAQRVDVVVHLAAVVHKPNASEEEFYAINYQATAALFDLSRSHKVQQFIFVSTVAVFGDDTSGVFSEESTCHPLTPYAASKLAAEKYIRGQSDSKIHYTIVRPTTVYGKYDQGNIARLLAIVKGRVLPIIGDGNNLKSLVYVENLVEGITKSVLNPNAFDQVFIMSDEEPYTLNLIVKEMEGLIGKKTFIIRLPLVISFFILKSLEHLLLPVFKRKMSVSASMRKFAGNTIYDISKAKKMLSYAPIFTLKEGLRRGYGK
jgi:nucleoside-diphosphate-sugar epimerase